MESPAAQACSHVGRLELADRLALWGLPVPTVGRIPIQPRRSRMVDQQLFTRTLADFARRLVHRYEVSEVLYELAERTAAVVGIAAAGVTVVDDNGLLRFAASSADVVTPLERLQEQ